MGAFSAPKENIDLQIISVLHGFDRTQDSFFILYQPISSFQNDILRCFVLKQRPTDLSSHRTIKPGARNETPFDLRSIMRQPDGFGYDVTLLLSLEQRWLTGVYRWCCAGVAHADLPAQTSIEYIYIGMRCTRCTFHFAWSLRQLVNAYYCTFIRLSSSDCISKCK